LGRQVQIPSEDIGKNAQGGKSPETYDSLAAAKNELKLPTWIFQKIPPNVDWVALYRITAYQDKQTPSGCFWTLSGTYGILPDNICWQMKHTRPKTNS
jgi:hypothetical protein